MGTMTLTKPDWPALYLRHRDSMYRVARSALRSIGRPDLAEDAVHDVMTSIIADPDRMIANPEAYLVKAARLRALAIAKLHGNCRGAQWDEAEHPSDGFEADAVQRLDRARLYQRLHQEVAALPDMQRRVIEEVIIKERTATQVATEMGLSKSRVSQLQKAALLALRDRLGKGPIA